MVELSDRRIRKLAWFSFYPGDWIKDPALSRCSFNAQGVWMRILCLAFESETRGVLATAGKPWTDEEIVHAIGGDNNLALSALHELIDKGVAHRNTSGAVYSRRLIRDEENRKSTSQRVSAFRERSCESKDVTPSVTKLKPVYDSGNFDVLQSQAESLFAMFPKHHDKKNSMTEITKALRIATYEVLQEAVVKYSIVREGQDPKFTMSPRNWFRDQRWMDEVRKYEPKPDGKSSVVEPDYESIYSIQKAAGNYPKFWEDYTLEEELSIRILNKEEVTREMLVALRVKENRDTPEKAKEQLLKRRKKWFVALMEKKGIAIIARQTVSGGVA